MKKIQVLGTGCPKCQQLAAAAEAAAQAVGCTYTLEKVTSPGDIVKYGVMMTPALVVDGKVKVSGRIPTPSELQEMLK
ncbi:MAG: thioredoxin family protein [Tepidisphaerales bacterium]